MIKAIFSFFLRYAARALSPMNVAKGEKKEKKKTQSLLTKEPDTILCLFSGAIVCPFFSFFVLDNLAPIQQGRVPCALWPPGGFLFFFSIVTNRLLVRAVGWFLWAPVHKKKEKRTTRPGPGLTFFRCRGHSLFLF
nr:hypothetical protein [Pandoravirus aubagnensis]